MKHTKNQKFIILNVLKENYKSVRTKASEIFKIGQEVTAGELNKFAEDYGMIIESSEFLILIKNIREVVHVKAVIYRSKVADND